MTSTIADSQQRREALDPTRSFIIQAPAGSGKTELLTRRFLTLLSKVESPEEIVAITFTRKAAAEMRSRIIKALQEAKADSEIGHIAQIAMAHDQAMGWHLLEHPNRLRIQTIDSLCKSLTQRMPILSRFGAQPDLLSDASEQYRIAARNTLAHLNSDDDWSGSITCLLKHLDNNWPVAEQLLASLLSRRDQWLRHITEINSQPDLRIMLEGALQETIAASLSQLRATLPQDIIYEFLALVRFAAANLEIDTPEHPLVPCGALSCLPGEQWPELPHWCALAGLLLTDKGTWRIQITKNMGFPPPSNTKDSTKKALYQQMKERFSSLIARLESHDLLREQLTSLKDLPSPHYSDTQWQVLGALTKLLPLAAAELLLVFRQHNRVDFTEIALAAIHALGSPQAPSDLALSLDYRISHLLVDEFQDTSFSQFLLLERLTAGWQEGDGRTLLLVGDPMQSIYRFREANVGLFLWARRNGIGQVSLTPLTLCVNFRSEQALIGWVNKTFEQLMPNKEDITTGAVCYSPSTASKTSPALNAVHVHSFIGHFPEQEAEAIADIVYTSQKSKPDCKIAILVRARNHLAHIIPALRATQIPYRAVEIEQLKNSPIIQDLISLTRALLHAADRVAWLSLLRAPWCGLTLNDLTSLCGDDRRATVLSLLHDNERLLRLSEDGQQRVQRLMQSIRASQNALQRNTLRHHIESTWLALGGPACARNINDLEEANVFFTMLEGLDEGATLTNLDRLHESVEKLFALPDSSANDALQLMTIHKAKGLEFDVVILPGLGRRSTHDEARLLLWMEHPSRHQGGNLLLAPIKEAGTKDDKIYDYLKFIEKEKSKHETTRLLYVAATRAKHQLHLLGHTLLEQKDDASKLRMPHNGSLLAQLWPVVIDEFNQALVTHPAAHNLINHDIPNDQPLRRLPRAWQLPTPPPGIPVHAESAQSHDEAIEFLWASNTIRHIGTVVHRYLRQIAHKGLHTWPRQRIKQQRQAFTAALKQLGVPAPDLALSAAKVEQALINVCNDAKGKWILSDAHSDAQCEYALTGDLHNKRVRIIIDRTFVDTQGIRWIIDYKTSSHEGSDIEAFLTQEQARYQAQLERYAQLFQLYEHRPIRLGLYFPLLIQWREWTFSSTPDSY